MPTNVGKCSNNDKSNFLSTNALPTTNVPINLLAINLVTDRFLSCSENYIIQNKKIFEIFVLYCTVVKFR